MEPKGSLPHSQASAACPCTKPDQFSACPSDNFLKIHCKILYSHLGLGFPSGLFPSGFPTGTLYAPLLSPIRATCATHIILDFITQTNFSEQYRSLSSSLCSFLHSPVTWSLLGTNIPFNTLFSNTFSLRYSLNVSDQVAHPYRTRKRIHSSKRCGSCVVTLCTMSII